MKQKFYFWAVSGLVTLVILVWSILAIIQEAHNLHWQELPIIYVLLGAFGCLLLIYLAKFIAKYLLKRKEDYYD